METGLVNFNSRHSTQFEPEESSLTA